MGEARPVGRDPQRERRHMSVPGLREPEHHDGRRASRPSRSTARADATRSARRSTPSCAPPSARPTSTPTVTGVIIDSASENFAVGGDLKEMLDYLAVDPPSWDLWKFRDSLPFEAIRACRKPTIAVVDGICCGGGFATAISCDFILASPTSRFGTPETKVGLMDGLVAPALYGQVPLPVIKYLLFSGELIDADVRPSRRPRLRDPPGRRPARPGATDARPVRTQRPRDHRGVQAHDPQLRAARGLRGHDAQPLLRPRHPGPRPRLLHRGRSEHDERSPGPPPRTTPPSSSPEAPAASAVATVHRFLDGGLVRRRRRPQRRLRRGAAGRAARRGSRRAGSPSCAPTCPTRPTSSRPSPRAVVAHGSARLHGQQRRHRWRLRPDHRDSPSRTGTSRSRC